MRQIVRAWSEFHEAESDTMVTATEPRPARGAQIAKSDRQARFARLRLGMF